MSDSHTQATAKPVARSRPYLRLLWLIPGLAALAVGLQAYLNVPEGGTVTSIKLTTKSGMVGQAAEAVANVKSNPDLYLKVYTADGQIKLPAYKDTPVGNSLSWDLPRSVDVHQLQRVEVWDEDLIGDEQLDRITLSDWGADGQRFHVDLIGQKIAAPNWALPVAGVGGTLSLLVLLRFVWDQVI